jgi:hypothetical protein
MNIEIDLLLLYSLQFACSSPRFGMHFITLTAGAEVQVID